ncbi:hypothetical protein K438DRAFT_1914382 [Mycena galopus ATCC 62051]|nr:hypothetical protein K438DRAFT_1914382 [Mycena galopus ATCC 62051]
MEPTEYDIRREVEALKDLRRRSTAPGALTLDPDLPNQNPPSPTSPYREPGSSARPSPDPAPSSQASADDPFHLFWVPAGLHPEIAPAEFRAFLKEHARNPPSDDEPDSLHRAPSSASAVSVSSGLGRKKSMLSRQYQPSEKDDSADDTVVPLRRNRSIFSSNQNQGPQLTISDLQKLEELAEEASASDDPSKLRNILRRSLSLNVSPMALDDDLDLGDEADQPIVGAGKFLRRTPRTRIRKPNLPGDGGGHRFGERRRGPSSRSTTSPILQRTSSDVSSSDHTESVESVTPRARTTFSEEGPPPERPDSFSEEVLIYDAYARDEEDEYSLPPSLPPVFDFADIPPPQPEVPPRQDAPPVPDAALPPLIHQPQPTRLLSPAQSDPPQQTHLLSPSPLDPSQPPAPPSRTPSPSDLPSPDVTPTNSPPASSFLSTSPSPQRKEKDKKGLFGKWGGDKEKEKSSKASKKERERLEKERREKEQRDKESGFFGSLFGSKKKHDAPAETSSSHAGRETAQALLGQSQRAPKSPGPPSPMAGMPGMMGGAGGINNYSRYPIHVERAIYRLSHIKLANPRRPLYEQVLISNLMFWYLGVINKAQAAAQAEQAAQAAAANATPEGEKERLERERAEREAAAAAQERAEKERVEREAAEREQRERTEREMEKKKRDASPRRGALTKAVPPGSGPQQRRAEQPVKGPQFEMQHRSMEKEYAGYNGNGAIRPGPNSAPGPGQGGRQQSPTTPKFNQQQIAQGPEKQHYYYSPGEAMQQQQQQRLPPGAMAPVDQSTWLVGQAPARKQGNASPPPTNVPQRRSRSPPPPVNMNQQPMPVYNPDGGQGGARLGGRSLSATAVPSPSPSPPINGKIRKGQSAYAGTANGQRRPRTGDAPPVVNGGGGGGEEEDMPLAMWQRQQRR